MDAKGYLDKIISHEENIVYLLSNPTLPRVKARCFRNLLGILCCSSLFEGGGQCGGEGEAIASKEGLGYRIKNLRDKGFDDQSISNEIISSRDGFVYEKEIKLGYPEFHQRRLHCELYSRVLDGLDKLLESGQLKIS